MRKEYGRSFEPCAGSQLVHATAVASASGTAAIGEVVCIGVLCDFAFGPLRRLRLEAQSGPMSHFAPLEPTYRPYENCPLGSDHRRPRLPVK